MGITNLVTVPTSHFQLPRRLKKRKKKMLSIWVLIVVVAATAQVAEFKAARHGLRQAKANPDRDVEHMRCPSFKLFGTWNDDIRWHSAAEKKCKEWGGELASLNTLAKIQFVADMLDDGQFAWIGGECVDCDTVKDDKWMWKSGDRLDLQNPMWKDFEGQKPPYDGQDSKNDAIYLAIYKKDGDVQFVNWSGRHNYTYLCEE